MQNKKSLIAFFIVIGISSLIYILYDFLNSDVNEVTAVYGWVQLVIAICATVTMRAKKKLFYILFSLILLMQIVPAFFWFWFNGQIVNDKPYDGVMGNWLFGAYHLVIILWGIFNIHQYRKEME